MYQDFITAFSPFFDGFFGMVNNIIRIFFDIRIFEIPVIMFVIVPAFIIGLISLFFRGKT